MKTGYASLRVLAMLGAGIALTPQMALAQDADAGDDLIENADVEDQSVIVVTAQGREQILADVPVAINAVSA